MADPRRAHVFVEADYLYGRGPLTLRIDRVGRANPVRYDGEPWLQVDGGADRLRRCRRRPAQRTHPRTVARRPGQCGVQRGQVGGVVGLGGSRYEPAGLDVCRALRADPRTAATPALIASTAGSADALTAGWQPERRPRGQPFNNADLLARAETLISRAAEQAPTAPHSRPAPQPELDGGVTNPSVRRGTAAPQLAH